MGVYSACQKMYKTRKENSQTLLTAYILDQHQHHILNRLKDIGNERGVNVCLLCNICYEYLWFLPFVLITRDKYFHIYSTKLEKKQPCPS